MKEVENCQQKLKGSHVHLPEYITLWIAQYGNFALFILLAIGILGLPIPDETLITFSGALVAQQKLPFALTQFTVFLGAVFGITLSYILGRLFGSFVLVKYGYRIGVTEKRIQQVHEWFERIGKWTLLFGYFIPGVRHVTGIVAGSAQLRYHQFALFAYTGALIWSQVFFLLGFYFSRHWHTIINIVETYARISGIILLILLAVFITLKIIHQRNKKK